MIIRLISCFKHPGRSRRERSELFAEIIGNHLVLESPGRSRAERRELIRNIIKYIEIQGCALIRFFTKPFPTVPFFYETFCTKPSLNETFCTKPSSWETFGRKPSWYDTFGTKPSSYETNKGSSRVPRGRTFLGLVINLLFSVYTNHNKIYLRPME